MADGPINPKADIKLNEYAEEDVPNAASVLDEAFLKREKALVRKLDYFIAPVMMLLMLISYLDRGNVGFAATQGMIEDINLVGSQLNVSPTSQLDRKS